MQENLKIKNNFKGIIDSTLREGEQFVFGNFSLREKKSIVRLLTQIGVDRIEVGNPLTPGVNEDIKALKKVKNVPPILAHIRNRLEDVHQAVEAGVSGVHILCTVDQERLASMNMSFSDYLDNLKRVVVLAKENNLEARVSVEDYWGQDKRRAMRVYRVADGLGVDRIGVADTLGVATPQEVAKDIRKIRREIKAEIEVHFHNDTGCAVANALAALGQGANWVDTTLLGIGERTGITPLSTFLLRLYTIDPKLVRRYKLEFLTRAENRLAQILGISLPFNLITNRQTGFSHKAGIHINALVNIGPSRYELVPPGLVGNKRQIITGSRISGRTSTRQLNQFYKKFGKD